MRITRVLFRTKKRLPGPHLSVKVVTNCRIRTKKQPIQIHLGYLSLMIDGEIPQGQRAKLLRNLREKWKMYFPDEDVDIDWNDAERKWKQLRAARASTSGIMAASARLTLERERRDTDPHDAHQHPMQALPKVAPL